MTELVPHDARRGAVAVENLFGPVAEPQFDLPPDTIVLLDGRRHLVERRLDDTIQFLCIDDRQPLFKSDAELARMAERGRFHLEWINPRTKRAEKGVHLFAVTPEQHRENRRKAEYVEACYGAKQDFARSRRILQPIIRRVAESRGEKPPGFTTVLNWIDEDLAYGLINGSAAHTDRHDLKGNHGSRMASFQEVAIEKGIARWLSGPRVTKAVAYAKVWRTVRAYERKFGHLIDRREISPDLVDEDGRLRVPSQRTFERRCAEVDKFTRTWHRVGPRAALRLHHSYMTTARPDRPYSHVDVDHCTLDILIIDDGGIVLGRPDLILFRDRATGMVIGYGLGFEAPSYASFLEGLRHAMFPKDLSWCPRVRNPWPCWGRIENLYVDNGLHFLGDNIREAAKELRFNLVRFQPRQPWLKGALERLFGTLNTGLVHLLPGTTLEHVLARRDNEHLGEATLTLAEFEALLVFWICEIYHAGLRKALGPIRGVGDVPLRVWAEKAKEHATAPLPSPDLFTALAGDTDTRTIQGNGVTWDYITYEDGGLARILVDPAHKSRQDGREPTRYKVVRNPYDLGQIWVVNHHTGDVLTVPATMAHQTYATGLTLHQHQVIMARARRAAREAVDIEALMKAKDELADIASRLRNHPSRTTIRRRLARFLDAEQRRRIPSRIAFEQPTGGRPAGHLDIVGEAALPAAPVPQLSKPLRRVVHDPVKPPKAPAAPAAFGFDPVTAAEGVDDLAALRAAKGWSAKHE